MTYQEPEQKPIKDMTPAEREAGFLAELGALSSKWRVVIDDNNCGCCGYTQLDPEPTFDEVVYYWESQRLDYGRPEVVSEFLERKKAAEEQQARARAAYDQAMFEIEARDTQAAKEAGLSLEEYREKQKQELFEKNEPLLADLLANAPNEPNITSRAVNRKSTRRS